MINITQLVVKTDKKIIEWLECKGYANYHNLPKRYDFGVFIVDLPDKDIHGTNTMCMAASCSVGNKPIILDFEELKEKVANWEQGVHCLEQHIFQRCTCQNASCKTCKSSIPDKT